MKQKTKKSDDNLEVRIKEKVIKVKKKQPKNKEVKEELKLNRTERRSK